ncbi:hypothetical protein ZIOFF_031848 [Zingiber officinale]|uniref:Nucleoside diphosphate kinase-like domain-containing protein n=1 Tax=Zingiber officinale TaxID=94328 RepID=A0A8J5L0N2_ZINOF|nr:hypothetical protein ZIOFF_031848 [Zingiber officinale]
MEQTDLHHDQARRRPTRPGVLSLSLPLDFFFLRFVHLFFGVALRLKLVGVERSFAEKHYVDLSMKPFFGSLVEYIISGPVVAMGIWNTEQAAHIPLTDNSNIEQILGSTYIATLLVQPLLPAWIFNHENCCFLLVQTDADGLVNRGNTFKEIGRVTEAIQDYIRAVNIRPTMPEAHANLASTYKDSLQISSTPELKLMKCGSSGLNAC